MDLTWTWERDSLKSSRSAAKTTFDGRALHGPVCPQRCKIAMHNFFINSIWEKTWIGIVWNIREITGAYMWDILTHWANKPPKEGLACILEEEDLLSKSKIRGWLICEIGLYAVYTWSWFFWWATNPDFITKSTSFSQVPVSSHLDYQLSVSKAYDYKIFISNFNTRELQQHAVLLKVN